jgi:crotonobetainyl-CoA:carnitine CoA-transferase CaiB-like acyl-CoA transferase
MSWRPLDGVRVLVLGSSRAARFAGRTLASLGAAVTRIAPPGLDPPPEADPLHGGASERERRLGLWLDGAVDVVVAGSPGEVADLAAAQPRPALVVHDADLIPPPGARAVALSAGLTAHEPACGLTAAARAGVAVAVGAPDREPLEPPFQLSAYATGLVAAAAGLSLLDGPEGVIEVTTTEVLAAFGGVNALVYEPHGVPWRRERRRAAACAGPYPYGFLRASDGDVCIIGRTRRDWERILAAAGDPPWAADERYADLRRNGAEHADELDEKLEQWTAGHTRAELLEAARRYNLSLAPVRTPEEVLDDESLWSCGALLRVGDTTVPGLPVDRIAPPASGPVPARPLAGARVLDLGWVWSAPMLAASLADLGADVVKVEHADALDNSRLRGRPEAGWLEHDGAPSIESVPYFLSVNHGKRSIVLDLKHPDGAQVARELMTEADLVVENLGEPRFAALGLGYEQAAAANPGLIWLSLLTALSGPPDLRGYAPTISSYSGFESAVGYEDELTGMMSFGICDPIAGTFGLLLALAALHERSRTGEGALLRLGQLEAFLALLGEQLEEEERIGAGPRRANWHPYFAPHGVFRARDGRYVAIAARDDTEREALVRATGGADLAAWVASIGGEEVVAKLSAALPCALVLEQAEARSNPELGARGLLAETDHPLVGCHRVYTQAWRSEGRAPTVRRAAPPVGAHTREVLEEWLGFGDERIEALERSGALR